MKIMAEPICESIEPVSKDIQCQRTAGHCGMHWAQYRTTEGGVVTVEWHDAEWIRNYLHEFRGLNDDLQGERNG